MIFLALNSKSKGTGEGMLLLACGSWMMAMTESIPSPYGSGYVSAVRPQEDEVIYPAPCTRTQNTPTQQGEQPLLKASLKCLLKITSCSEN